MGLRILQLSTYVHMGIGYTLVPHEFVLMIGQGACRVQSPTALCHSGHSSSSKPEDVPGRLTASLRRHARCCALASSPRCKPRLDCR